MRKIDSTDVVMLGNSLTELGGDWNRLLRWRRVRNRGISGDDATGILHRLGQILPGKPKAIFLMVGINDLSHDLTPVQVFDLCK
ncbi:MAG: serine acetyltransferase, partial [Prevotella pleuritidis]|nr:serine acetyltransferase [Hoylesella pleuritidis]